MNKVYERMAELMLEGEMYGDDPGRTGKTVGRAMNKFYKHMPAAQPEGALGDMVNLLAVQKKKDQVGRIKAKVAKRHQKNVFPVDAPFLAEYPTDFRHYMASKIRRGAEDTFGKSYSAARASGDYRGRPENN